MRQALLILFTIISISCCERFNCEVDYRDDFIGTYQCSKEGQYHCGDSTIFIDSIEVVNITKERDSMINIIDAILFIDESGGFGGGLYPDSAYHGFAGQIVGDSIFFNTYQGGLGCFTSLKYKGYKL